MMRRLTTILAAASALAFSTAALASPFTTTSPTGGALPSTISAVGGVVIDLTGSNGTRILSQVAASTEYIGSPSTSENPLIFATQNGFDASVVGALGGGITAASFRISLYDGDSQSGNFDFGNNSLLVNGIDFGDFSSVATQRTNGTGTTVFSSGLGFGDDILSTGFFSSTDSTKLSALFTSLLTGKVNFALFDTDPGDQYFDFTQGLDASVIDIGTGPVVTPPVVTAAPEPATWAMFIFGFGLAGSALRRRQKVNVRVSYAA